jgi:hypothetical protein
VGKEGGWIKTTYCRVINARIIFFTWCLKLVIALSDLSVFLIRLELEKFCGLIVHQHIVSTQAAWGVRWSRPRFTRKAAISTAQSQSLEA